MAETILFNFEKLSDKYELLKKIAVRYNLKRWLFVCLKAFLVLLCLFIIFIIFVSGVFVGVEWAEAKHTRDVEELAVIINSIHDYYEENNCYPENHDFYMNYSLIYVGQRDDKVVFYSGVGASYEYHLYYLENGLVRVNRY